MRKTGRSTSRIPEQGYGIFLCLKRGSKTGVVEDHGRWLEEHLCRRLGERKNRLERGHGHGEKLFLEQVWWPIFGHFRNWHPEYEVSDWRGRPYFVDLVWKLGQVQYAIEIKGYGPHVTNMDRIRYRQELKRETFLQMQNIPL
ncbi:hypothetical protein [Paenibacillus sp. sgz500958]|uniref:hypothetical protein n=1 Tax=Paenibacillus sp. sgz500958 TaxID=3242475 RepID=UPI0036D2D65C